MIKEMTINYHGEDIVVTAQNIEDTARLVHEANSVLRAAFKEPPRGNWDNSTPEIKESAKHGATKFIESGFSMTPAQMHTAWMTHKVATGWIYGEVIDDVLKTHPNMRPYHELPIEQHAKDLLFTTIIETIWLDITGVRQRVAARLGAEDQERQGGDQPLSGEPYPFVKPTPITDKDWVDPDHIEG